MKESMQRFEKQGKFSSYLSQSDSNNDNSTNIPLLRLDLWPASSSIPISSDQSKKEPSKDLPLFSSSSNKVESSDLSNSFMFNIPKIGQSRPSVSILPVPGSLFMETKNLKSSNIKLNTSFETKLNISSWTSPSLFTKKRNL